MSYSSRLMMIVSLVNFASMGDSGLEQPQNRPSDDVAADDDGKAPAETWDDLAASTIDRLRRLSEQFATSQVTPSATFAFEQDLDKELCEFGRRIVQSTFNRLEPATNELPKHLRFEDTDFTRLNKKTPQNSWSLFGQIRLLRAGYRATDKDIAEPTIFPLAICLGLVHGATPALAERVGRMMAEAGANQLHVLRRLKSEHGVGWGVPKLRQVTQAVSQAVTDECHEVQVRKLLELLECANGSKGRHRPVLSVGRDGITLGMRCKGGCMFNVASTATVAVYGRNGKRLGTVYLAQAPELGQDALSASLTLLVTETLRRWTGKLPRLCYVTDSGDNETSYYEKVLSKMKDPRDDRDDKKKKLLKWIRVVDFYHAGERVWSMARILFGEGMHGASWARKMLKWMLKPGGVYRVLHSAAAFRDLKKLSGKKLAKFETDYAYLRDRMRFMRYAEYRAVGIPLGSGVTEAACKTIFTQRLKQSGMTWRHAGAQTILNLRVLLLSGTWDAAYQRVLAKVAEPKIGGHMDIGQIHERIAA